MRRILAYIARDARLSLSYPSTLVTPFLSIAVTVGGFAFLSRIVNPHAQLDSNAVKLDYFSYVVLNLAFMSLLNAALQSVPAALRRDQVAGTLEPMVGSRAPVTSLIAGSAAWPMLFALLQFAAYIGCGVLFGLRVGSINVALLATFFVSGALCMGAVGVIASAIVIAFKQTPPSALLTGGAATLLAGVLFPVTLLPHALQILSWMLPLTHALSGMRAAMSGAPFHASAGDAVWLAAASAALVPAGLLAFHLALERARCDGSLSAY